jgi:hypothetical protein
LAPAFTRKTFPVTHLVSPTCSLASPMGRQSEAASALEDSRKVSTAILVSMTMSVEVPTTNRNLSYLDIYFLLGNDGMNLVSMQGWMSQDCL